MLIGLWEGIRGTSRYAIFKPKLSGRIRLIARPTRAGNTSIRAGRVRRGFFKKFQKYFSTISAPPAAHLFLCLSYPPKPGAFVTARAVPKR